MKTLLKNNTWLKGSVKLKSVRPKMMRAFTLVELMITIVLITFIGGVVGLGLIGAVCKGNEWFTPEGVLMELKNQDPNIIDVVTYKRKVYRKSVVTAKLKNGALREYYLDSNILFNYELTLKQ